MKKLILTIATIAVAIIGTVNYSHAAAKNTDITVLSDMGSISKIEVHGNVQVWVTTGTKNEVTVANKYYAESAFVQNKNGVLSIASYNDKQLIVLVSATNLNSITAYDNSVVKSDASLSALELNVELHDKAFASLNVNAFTATVVVKDQARTEIKGMINDYNATYSATSMVNRESLVADNVNETKLAPKAVKQALKAEVAEEASAVVE